MANKTIPQYSAAGGIDASADLFLIWQSSTNTYRNINRNAIMGVSGAPADISSAQNITNKTLNNSNIVTLRDDRFTLQDNLDTTKQAQFQLSGITTATTRTYTLPNASSTLADISTVQTFTNKTLTSPVITGGSITNSTVSVDSVSEFTSGNGVTVDGLNIKDGKLNTNNSVITSNITDAAVTPVKLQSGTGNSWSWQSFSPTFGNLTTGNGTLSATYVQTGKTVTGYISLLFGSTSAVSGSVTFTLPVTAAARYATSNRAVLGQTTFVSTGVNTYPGYIFTNGSNTVATLSGINASATYATEAQLSATVPFTWKAGDSIQIMFTYEAA